MSTTMDDIKDHGPAHHHDHIDRSGPPLVAMEDISTTPRLISIPAKWWPCSAITAPASRP